MLDIYSPEDLSAYIFKTSDQTLREISARFSLPKLTLAAECLQKMDSTTQEEKGLAILRGLKSKEQFEAFGKGCSVSLFLSLLKGMSDKQALVTGLSPLLVGLSPHIFFEALIQLPDSLLTPLKHESILEPLQHLLNVFVNECKAADEAYLIQFDHLQQVIIELNPLTSSRSDIQQIEAQISQLREKYEHILNGINRALALTWASCRLDLIEKLNTLKEIVLIRLNEIGLPPSDLFLPTGLFNFFINHLSQVFKSPTEANDFLKDEDPSIEGLAKFSIWYLTDYWKAGLLPSIHSESEIESEQLNRSKAKALEHCQQLVQEVQSNLNRIGIRTVGDLKKARIFSKDMLQEYISKHQKVLLMSKA